MMDPSGVKKIVEEFFPDAEVEVFDLTGTFDHFQIRVVSELFRGKSLIEQHRLVQQAVQSALSDGRIHAIQVKTSIPKEVH